MNRAKRRTLWQTRDWTVHMFSGAGVKNDPLRDLPGLVEMDIRKGWDLNDDKIYGVVLWMAREGRVKHVVGGPPAGTFAPWHYKKDQEGRQRPLRSTHEPWGLREGLNPDESSKVLNEDVMQWCGYGCAQKLRMRAKRGITAGTMLGSVWSTRRTPTTTCQRESIVMRVFHCGEPSS